MAKHRFFLPQDCFLNAAVRLPPSVQSQVKKVLRLAAGDEIDVLDGSGFVFHAQLVDSSDGNLAAEIIQREHVPTEPGIHITLMVALTQREKFEWILQKCTEIGVSAFQPFISSRTLIRKADQPGKKQERWSNIVREAAEQSGRGRIPQLMNTQSLDQCLAGAANAQMRVLAAWADRTQPDLGTVLSTQGNEENHIGLIIGPEGGFSFDEMCLMRAAAVQPFSLGSRTLRMETAAILAPALVLYELGDLRASE